MEVEFQALDKKREHISRKRSLGQYFTKKEIWLKDHIKDFILQSGCSIAYDPFAGNGDILQAVKELGFKKTAGLDIDPKMGWKHNDSLVNIPHIKNAIIVTNPPYLSNYSAKRRKILDDVKKYFSATKYDDLYLLALEKMLKAQDYVVAIIPETFINSSFPKSRVHSITIIEEQPFEDTETPVCVVCFDGKIKSLDKVMVYKNSHFKSTLGELEGKRLKTKRNKRIRFNVVNGKIALRAVDTTDPKRMIEFMRKEDLNYDLSGIKHSSRLITIIDVKVKEDYLNKFIEICNNLLKSYRESTQDILLSPFKGNMKNGVRRRRLDYETARAIMEKALENNNAKEYRNIQLFT